MNKDRRKRIEACINGLAEIREKIEQIQSEEQEALDNTPENLADSDASQKSQEAIDTMDSEVQTLHEIENNLSELLQ